MGQTQPNKLFQLTEVVANSVQQTKDSIGKISDGYHTFDELYHYRMLYNALWLNRFYQTLGLAMLGSEDEDVIEEFEKEWDIHKSWKHSDGNPCFGGGWFIVTIKLPTGQVSNHYKAEHWDKFKIPARDVASEWDGHTPQDAAERMEDYLLGEF